MLTEKTPCATTRNGYLRNCFSFCNFISTKFTIINNKYNRMVKKFPKIYYK